MEVCPSCGSPDIEYASTMRDTTAALTGLGLPQIYVCKNCWYQGSVIVRTERPGDFARPVKEAQRIDTKIKSNISLVKAVGIPILVLFAVAIAGLLLTSPGNTAGGKIAVMREAVTGSFVGYRVLGFEDIFLSFFLVFFSAGALVLAVYFWVVGYGGKKK